MSLAHSFSTNIKLLKTQLNKAKQSEGFLGITFGPLIKTGLPLIGNLLKRLAQSVSMLLKLTAAASAKDPAIHKKMFESGDTTLIFSYDEINDVIKIVRSYEKPCLLKSGYNKTIKN